MNNIIRLFLTTLLCLSFTALFAESGKEVNEYYVSVNEGNDSNDGTSQSPWASIQYAVNNASDGATIHVAAGVYDEFIRINEKSVSILGEEGTVIKPSPEQPVKLRIIPQQVIQVDNRILKSGQNGPMVVKLEGLTIDGENFSGNEHLTYGIFVQSDETPINITILDNEIRNIQYDGDDCYGIYVAGLESATISENTITDVKNAIKVNAVRDLLMEENHVVFESIEGTAIDIGHESRRKSGSDLTKASEGVADREKISGQKIEPPKWTWTLIGNELSGGVSERSVPDKGVESSRGMYLSPNIFDSSSPAIEVNARDNIVRGFREGIVAQGNDDLTVNVHHNVIEGNEEGVISRYPEIQKEDSKPPVVNATNNWWGDPSGPGGEGSGSGDSVSEDVVYSPWLGNEPGSEDAVQYIVDESGSVQDAVDDAKERSDSGQGSGHRITFQGSFTDGLDATGSGVILSPGSSPGWASFTGDFEMGPTETLEVDIDGSVPGTDYDQITVLGNTNLGGANLLVNLGFSPELGDQFIIFKTSAFDNEFSAGETTSASYNGLTYTFSISYPGGRKGTTGEVVLEVENIQSNAVATPLGLWSLLLAAGLAMTFLMRKKQ